MIKFKSILDSVLGKIEQIDSERYFLTIGSFIISIFLLLMCGIHLILGLKTSTAFIGVFSSLAILGH
jgi:hypothetical protein